MTLGGQGSALGFWKFKSSIDNEHSYIVNIL